MLSLRDQRRRLNQRCIGLLLLTDVYHFVETVSSAINCIVANLQILVVNGVIAAGDSLLADVSRILSCHDMVTCAIFARQVLDIQSSVCTPYIRPDIVALERVSQIISPLQRYRRLIP